MTHDEAFRRIQGIAARFSEAQASDPENIAVLGCLLGALHSLARCALLKYNDKPEEDSAVYSAQLSADLAGIGQGTLPIDGQWLAGFYFNSSIYRLAAVFHVTLTRLVGVEASPLDGEKLVACWRVLEGSGRATWNFDLLRNLVLEASRLKEDTLLATDGRVIRLSDAVIAAEQAASLVLKVLA